MTDTDRALRLERFREEVEDLQNVVGVGYDPETGKVVALVTTKMSKQDLPPNQLVANNTSLSKDDHGVVEVGDLEVHSLMISSAEKRRPVAAGAEEQPDGRQWVGTGGFLVRVSDPSKGTWADDVAAGTIARVSNWHVYVGDEFEPHQPINQPFRGDAVGELIGCVPVEKGVTVDVAARSVSTDDGWGVHGLDTATNGEEYGRTVVSSISEEHTGERVTKSGRTTGVTTARVNQIDASVKINFGTVEDPNRIRIDNCVITSPLGEKGDSGSAVYLEQTGALCGLYFAGSSKAGVFVQIDNIEAALGVEPISDWDPETPPVEYERDDLEQFKRDLVDFIENWEP